MTTGIRCHCTPKQSRIGWVADLGRGEYAVVSKMSIDGIGDTLGQEFIESCDVRVASCEKVGTKGSDVLFGGALKKRPRTRSISRGSLFVQKGKILA